MKDRTMKNDFGFTGRMQGATGGNVDLVVVDVEGEFLGFSMTEHQGLTMRRVAGEMRDLDQVIALRDCLDAFIRRTESSATTTS